MKTNANFSILPQSHMTLMILTLSTLALLGSSPGMARPVTAGPDLRLRVADATQVKRTTSVNWWDLHAGPKPAAALVPPPVPTDIRRPPLRVVVDIGHGGRDLGAPGHNGVFEKQIAFRVGLGVKRELERHGKLKDVRVEVRVTRDEDIFIPLRARVKMANEWGADLFVSVHANSSESPKAQGFEVYFLNDKGTDADATRLARTENNGQKRTTQSEVASILSDVQTTLHVNQSGHFAEVVFQAMSRRLRPNGRGVRQAPFTVLAGTQMPALLVEVGYVTHAEESKKLTSGLYLKRIANAISTGIVEFATHLKKLG